MKILISPSILVLPLREIVTFKMRLLIFCRLKNRFLRICPQVTLGCLTLLLDLRDGLQLVSNGLHSSCEVIVNSVVVSRHHGRSVVLNHCSENPNAGYKAQLDHIKYDLDTLFGAFPMSSMTYFLQDKDKKGYVSVFNSDIQCNPVKAPNAGGKAKFPFFHTPNRCAQGFRVCYQAYGQQLWTNNLRYIKDSYAGASKAPMPKKNKKWKGKKQ